MTKAIVTTTAETADSDQRPISSDWVLDGSPKTRSRELARSHDLTSYAMAWECTEGRFKWHYNKDETLVVLSGEAFITMETGEERRIGPGDVVFFPAGSSCTWRVTSYIRKVAFLRHTMPRPLGLAVIAWNKLLQAIGMAGKSPTMAAGSVKPENAPAN